MRPRTSLIAATALVSGLLAAPAHAATATVPAAFAITGSGSGHGVGMSQYGARGMALAGATYTEILSHYYTGTSVTPTSQLAASARTARIRVGISQGVANLPAVALRGEALGGGGAAMDITVGAATRTVPAGQAVTVTLYNGVGHVTFPDGATADGSHVVIAWNGTPTNGASPGVVNVALGSSASGALANLGTTCGNYFSGGSTPGSCNHRYRYGQIEVDSGRFGDSVRNLNVVVSQRLDDEYIKGIGEVPSSWPAAALQAQAVAARSYALASVLALDASSSAVSIAGFDRKVRSSCLCQVVDDTSDQNYVGFSKEYSTQGSRWADAVNATSADGAGQVVTYGSTVVKAFYSASTGGRTQAVRDVWGSTSMPWLASVDDHWSLDAPNPAAVWQDEVRQGDLVSRLNSALASAYSRAVSGGISCSKLQVADVASIEVLARYASGGVKQLGLADSGGNTATVNIKAARGCANITADRLRSVLGVSSTYVTGFTPSAGTLPGSKAISVRAITRVTLLGLPRVMINPAATVVSGRTTPAQYAATVELQELVAGQWTTVGSDVTDIRGAWALTLAAPAIGDHVYRAVARNALGAKRSRVARVSAVGTVTLASQRRAAAATSMAVNGIVTPVTAGVEVRIERLQRGKWRRIATAVTLDTGAWSATVPVPRLRATYRLRARTVDPRIGAVSSSVRRLTVF